MPFTIEQFLEVFKRYNLAVWPVQVILYILAFTAILFTIKKRPASDKIIGGILSFFWLWMGLVYHLVFFTTINKVAYVFAILFVVQGILFFVYGVLKNKLIFQFQLTIGGIAGMILIVFALIVYPFLGYLAGHAYPYAPTFGLPCPTTIFTLGLLLWIQQKNNFIILCIPLLWSFLGFFAASRLAMHEDTGLVISGLIFIIVAVIKNKKIRGKRIVQHAE